MGFAPLRHQVSQVGSMLHLQRRLFVLSVAPFVVTASQVLYEQLAARLDSPWSKAFLATGLISLVPTLVLPMIPLSTSVNNIVSINKGLHSCLLSFAAGGLLGDVFLHSLPHLLQPHQAGQSEKRQWYKWGRGLGQHEHTHGHSHDNEAFRMSAWTLVGFLVFFVAEKVVILVLGQDEERHGRHHAHADVSEPTQSIVSQEARRGEHNGHEGSMQESTTLRRRSARLQQAEEEHKDQGLTRDRTVPSEKGEQQCEIIEESEEAGKGSPGRLQASGYLNITVDVIHNLTDGIALGSAFATEGGLGLAKCLSVLLHEIPHEVGDYAILLQSGMSLRGAFLMQFKTAIAAFAGTFVGLVSQRQEGLERKLAALTSGGFLYVAAVSVLPNMLSAKTSLRQSAAEIVGICSGVTLMSLVALIE